MLIVAAHTNMSSLPESKVELYRIFVDLLCGGWDMAKGVRRSSDFASNLKVSVLVRLASVLHYAQLRDATESQIKRVIDELAPVLSRNWETLLADLLQDGILVQNGRMYTFRHLSFHP
jgi:predicted NACHT family NTPase